MESRNVKWKKQEGFTLIELLVVVVLLGILSGIAVFAVGNARDRAIAEACRSQEAQLLKGLDLYYIDNKGKWPLLGASVHDATVATTTSAWTSTELKTALVPKYLKQIPPYVGDANADYTLSARILAAVGTSGTTGFKPAYVQVSQTSSSVSPLDCPATP